MTLSIDYTLNFKASSQTSTNDTLDLLNLLKQVKYTTVTKPEVKRLDFQLMPVAISDMSPLTPATNSRYLTLDLQVLSNSRYIHCIYIISEYYFIYATGTSSTINSERLYLAKTLFIDTGKQPIDAISSVPKAGLNYPAPITHIKLINPLYLNGGGTGANPGDLPILVQLGLVMSNEPAI